MMMSGGFIDDIIGAGTSLIGGAIGSAFGDDTPSPGYGDKEYGTEARRMRFGTNVGRRRAMGDPTIDAYFQSKLKTDPELVNRFIDDFGADFRNEGLDFNYPATGNDAGGMFPGGQPPNRLNNPAMNEWMTSLRNQGRARDAAAASNTSHVLDLTLGRLSNPGSQQRPSGYSNLSFSDDQGSQQRVDTSKSVPLKKREAGSGNKYALLNKQRETGMF